MSRYWVIWPIFEEEKWERFGDIWKFDLDNGYISIGWPNLGDVSKMKNREELTTVFAKAYPGRKAASQAMFVGVLWRFYHVIKPGDWIIARRNVKTLKAVGRVIEQARHAPGTNPAEKDSGFLKVEWEGSPRDINFQKKVFSPHSLCDIPKEKFDEIVNRSPESADTSSSIDMLSLSEEKSEFVMEKYLEEFIVSNFDKIFKGRWNICKDEDGKNIGQQYDTDIGRIDILAEEPESGSFVVIELKKGKSSDEVVGQILRYMGWVEEILCKPGQRVKGRIICQKSDEKLKYALKKANDVDVRYYEVLFKLKETP